MGDEDHIGHLPRRVTGTARTGPYPLAPALSGEPRRRMHAEVSAERSAGLAKERQEAGPQGGEVTSPSVRGAVREKRKRTATVRRGRRARPGVTASAGLIAEDEVTEWLGGTGPPAVAEPGHQATVTPRPAADPSQAGPRLAAQVLVTVLVFALLTAVLVRHFTGSAGSAATRDAVASQEAAARDEAAAWVAQQVSRDVTVSCDRVMCAALAARGFPSQNLLVLGPTSPSAVRSAVVVETAAVQGLFGTSLAVAWAPTVLASFGSGPAVITVRVIAPHGAAAYQTALAASQAAGRAAGTALLTNPRVSVPGPASGQLAGGLVDSRLLRALKALAGRQPVGIVQFGNIGPGADAGIPLRFVDLAENDQGASLAAAAYVRAVRAYLSGVDIRFRPASMTTVVLPDGQAVLRVGFTAPSPFEAPA